MKDKTDIPTTISDLDARLLISWEQNVLNDPLLKELSLTKIKQMLNKYNFLEEKIDESMISIIRPLSMTYDLPTSSKKPTEIRKDALKLADLLIKVTEIFEEMPLGQHKEYLDKIPSGHPLAIPNHIHGGMDSVLLPANIHLVKLLVNNISHICTIFEVLIEVSNDISSKLREVANGRPPRNRSLENFVANLHGCWFLGTTKLPDLSQNRSGFLAFSMELGCGPPYKFTAAEIKGTVRSLITKHKKQASEYERKLKDELAIIARYLEESPHNLEPEHAKAVAQEGLSKASSAMKRKREPGNS